MIKKYNVNVPIQEGVVYFENVEAMTLEEAKRIILDYINNNSDFEGGDPEGSDFDIEEVIEDV